MRSDNILSTLGTRSSGLRRLWVEDSFSRLSNNGFDVGTGFRVEPRMGPGLNIRQTLLGSCHVSQRRGAAILSYEGAATMARFFEPEVRVKISVGLVQVLPSLRAFSVRTATSEVWTIAGEFLTTPWGEVRLVTGDERPSSRPASISATLTEDNIVAATALIAWAKPATVKISTGAAPVTGQLGLFDAPVPTTTLDEQILFEVTRQFLVGCGWSHEGNGLFKR